MNPALAAVGSVLVWAVLRSRMMPEVVVHSQRVFESQKSQLEGSFREAYEAKLGEGVEGDATGEGDGEGER